MDLPEDYASPEWIPPPSFTYNPVAAALRQLRTIQALQALGLRDAQRVDQLVAPILASEERRRAALAKAVVQARAKIRKGKLPTCPAWLHNTQLASEDHVARLLSRCGPRHGDASEFIAPFVAQGREHIESMRLTAALVENARGTALEVRAKELNAETMALARAFTTHLIALLQFGQ